MEQNEKAKKYIETDEEEKENDERRERKRVGEGWVNNCSRSVQIREKMFECKNNIEKSTTKCE